MKESLSPLQSKVYKIITKFGTISIIEISEIIFKETQKRYRPKSVNNSITSAIVQINKKYPGLIGGENHGQNGKIVWINKNDRIKVTLDQHVCKG